MASGRFLRRDVRDENALTGDWYPAVMFSIAAAVLAASLPTIELVRIESSWVGLGQPAERTYTFTHRGDHYVEGSRTVPQTAIDRFAAAIAAGSVTAIRGASAKACVAAGASPAEAAPRQHYLSFRA
jgi:hypothetical protein